MSTRYRHALHMVSIMVDNIIEVGGHVGQKLDALIVISPSCVGLGPPPPYKPSVDQNPDPQSDTNQRLEQKIADLEAIIQKNSQEMQHMQQELASNFQKQLMDMQQQFQTQLNRLESSVQNLKP